LGSSGYENNLQGLGIVERPLLLEKQPNPQRKKKANGRKGPFGRAAESKKSTTIMLCFAYYGRAGSDENKMKS